MCQAVQAYTCEGIHIFDVYWYCTDYIVSFECTGIFHVYRTNWTSLHWRQSLFVANKVKNMSFSLN